MVRWAGDGRPDKHNRQPLFLPMLFSSCESSPASLESSDKKSAVSSTLTQAWSGCALSKQLYSTSRETSKVDGVPRKPNHSPLGGKLISSYKRRYKLSYKGKLYLPIEVVNIYFHFIAFIEDYNFNSINYDNIFVTF